GRGTPAPTGAAANQPWAQGHPLLPVEAVFRLALGLGRARSRREPQHSGSRQGFAAAFLQRLLPPHLPPLLENGSPRSAPQPGRAAPPAMEEILPSPRPSGD